MLGERLNIQTSFQCWAGIPEKIGTYDDRACAEGGGLRGPAPPPPAQLKAIYFLLFYILNCDMRPIRVFRAKRRSLISTLIRDRVWLRNWEQEYFRRAIVISFIDDVNNQLHERFPH